MSALTDLLARVEKAEGPDRELARLIVCAVDPELADYEPSTLGVGSIQRKGQPGWTRGFYDVTASLDETLALVERVLPGFHILVSSCGAPPNANWPDCQWRASLKGDYDFISGLPQYSNTGANCATPALGLLAAMLKALIAQEAANG